MAARSISLACARLGMYILESVSAEGTAHHVMLDSEVTHQNGSQKALHICVVKMLIRGYFRMVVFIWHIWG